MRPSPARHLARTAVSAVVLALTASLLLLAPPRAAAAPAAAADVTDGLLLRYDLDQTTGSVVADTSGNGRDGTLVGGGTWTGTQGLQLDGVDDHVKLPNNLTAGLTSITVSVDVYIEPSQAGNYFIYNLGNTAVGSPASGSGYLFATGNNFRTAISNQWWNNERSTQPSPARTLARGVWKTVTYTQTGTTGTLFEDGGQVGQNTSVSWTPAQIGNGVTTRNLLGKSAYDADGTLKGKVRNFRIYDRALTASEVQAISLTDANRLASDKQVLSLGDTSAVTGNLTLPATAPYGSAVTWASSNPAVVATDGTVTRPGAGSAPVDVTLTATLSRGGATETKTFTVTVLPDESDQSKADAAAAALRLVHPDDVRGHLTLPTTGRYDATVTWASSDAAVVTPTGLVTRPAPGAGDDTDTELVATVTVGSATAARRFPLVVRQKPAPAPYAGYAFSYFVNNSIAGEKIYFAASRGNNALQWDELNDGEPVLESTYGERGLRDPFLIRSPEGDRFFLIATDLSIGRNGNWDRAQRQGSRYLEVWESTDLVNWSEQRHVLVSPETAGNTWAPEAYWDETLQQFVVFWASKIYAETDPGHTGNTYNRMLYATTRDFVTFSPTKVWQDVGDSRIDTTVIREGDTYYRFTKDEGAGTTGCSDIIQEKNDVLTAPSADWETQDGCIGRDAGTSAVEGPSIFKRNPGDTSPNKYYLFVDEYGGRGYIPLGTDDLEQPNWKVPAGGYTLPASPRHGTVLPVTAAELKALRDGLGAPELPTPVESDENGLVAHYPLTTDAKDVSGHGYDGTLQGTDASFADGALTLGGASGHVKLPNNMMTGLDAITVTSKVWVDPTQSGNYFLWNLGNTGSDGVGKGYLFATGNSTYRAAIASGNWSTEQGLTSGSPLPRGAWKTVTYTLEDGVATLYLDGVQVKQATGVTIKPGDIGAGATTANYIGRSAYNADGRLKGKVQDLRIYDRALTSDEVGDLADGGTGIRAVTLDSLKVPARIDATKGTVQLLVEPGTDLTALAPQYQVAATSTVSPSGAQDYSEPVTVTVTNADGGQRAWTVTAVEMRSPVLPGLYADPNIAEFDGTYYIYATTDGFPGWGGKEFYVWKSTNLADWTRSEEPFLTLDGANGNVPWATGNAWAPTIIERDGKYYFYFSGHNATLDRKTIGVAVADSPEGPFTAQPQAMVLNNEQVTSGQAIDPAAFRDPQTGKHYLLWGNGGPGNGPVIAELEDSMTALKPGTFKRINGLNDFREGLFVNFRQGIYHLTYAIDDTGSPNYRVGYATATSMDGPWTYRGVILEKDESQGILGTGHSSIVQVPGRDEWYIAYHRFAIPNGGGTNRETTIDRLTFGADGFIEKVVPTLSSVDPLVFDGNEPEALVEDGVLTLTKDDTVSALQYRLDGGAWTAYTGPVTLPAGSYEVGYRARGTNLQWSEEWTLDADVAGPTPVASVAPRILGSAVVGNLLSATTGTWSPTPATYGYQWLRDGRPIAGATGRVYRVTAADVGRRLAVRVTASGDGLTPATAGSAATARVAKARTTVRVTASTTRPTANRPVRLTVRVGASPAAAPVTGRVQVFVGRRQVAVKPVNGGRAVVDVRVRKPGATRVVVRYLGSAAAAPSQGGVVLRVRR